MANEPNAWGETRVVGKMTPRIDAFERLSGRAVYTRDIQLPGMLYAAILRCPHPHAKVTKIDTAKAAAMPGVRAVLSSLDPESNVPWYFNQANNKYTSRLFDPHCRYEGDEVAAVAAETPAEASAAIRAIEVQYEKLPFVVDMEEALKPDSPKMHDFPNRMPLPFATTKRGDVERGFAEADAVLEDTYRTSCEIHSPLETHGAVAKWEGRRLTVWESTQGVFSVREEIANALKMPQSAVRVIGHYMGGGFGSKLSTGKYSVIAAMLAKRTGTPVKCCLSREENFLCVGNRPPHILSLKAGVKKDGTITAFQMRGKGAVGAYPDFITTGFQVSDLYLCANVDIQEEQAFINAGQSRAFRAPGFPPCSWMLEQTMDAMAEKIAMDPVEFRLRNIPKVSQQRSVPYTTTGLEQCLVEGSAAFGWEKKRKQRKRNGSWLHGVGVACGLWGYAGGPPATAIVKVLPDGSVNLNMGAADLGTGTKTAMALIVAEELGVPLTAIEIEHADTATTAFTEGSGGSKTIVSDGPAVRLATLDVKAKLLALAAEQLKEPVETLSLFDSVVTVAGKPDKKLALRELQALGRQGCAVGVGTRGPNPKDKIVRPFAAQFAEVEVNRYTGEIRVLSMLAAHDSGRAINRLTYENQVIGGLTMGIGFALTEQRVIDRPTGKMVNANFHDYRIPTAGDVPAELTCIPIGHYDAEANNLGAKGLGEPATIPAAGAIANAIYNATGIRLKNAPITPSSLVAPLAERRKKGEV